MSESTLRRTKYTFYLYMALASVGFMSPFIIIFLTDRGITFKDLALAGSTMAIVSNFAEFPSGYVGDRYGRRISLIASQVCIALGNTGYFFTRSTLGIVGVYALLGLGVAFRSGSESAWLYDIFDEAGEAEQFTAVRSRAFAIGQWTGAATIVVGAVQYYFLGPTVPLLSTIAITWLSASVLFLLPKNARFEDDSDDHKGFTPREAVDMTRQFVSSSAVRTVVAASVIVAGAVYAASQLIQPTVLASIDGPAMNLFGVAVPGPFVLAAVYATYEALSGTLTDYAVDFEELVGTGPAILIVYGVVLGAMVVPLVVSPLTALAVLVFRTVSPVASPIRSAYLNDHAESIGRASMLSGISVLRGVVRIPFLLVGGTIADLITPTIAMAVIGVVAMVSLSAVILFDRPFLSPTENTVGVSA